MNSMIFGWTGKILRIDLGSSVITKIDTMDYARRFLGGRGIATRIYWEEVRPEISAFDPENPLILMSGCLVATGALGATRLTVMAKSPMLMPEGFCYGNLGGFFPSSLKKAGFDGVVVTGCAVKPTYICIKDGKVDLMDASSLWGKGTYKVKKILKEKHGEKVRFVATGISGENKCRNSTIITDHEGSATGGFGAVMGSKNLKAVAVVGTGRPKVARKKELTEINRHISHISKRGTLRMPMQKKHMVFVKTASCYQCTLDCSRGLFRTAKGREEVRKCQAMIFYLPYANARPEEAIDTTLDATKMCNDYSICTMDLQNIFSWLDACYKSGFLTDSDTGLKYSKIGTRKFFKTLISMISNREGFGDILAEGILRIGEKLGEKAKEHFNEYTNAVGLDGAYAPRQYPITALLYGMEPRQPIAQLHDISHLIARWLLHLLRPDLSPTSAEVFRKAATKFWGHEKAWDMTTLEGKAVATVKIQDHTYVKDSLGLCDFAWPIMDSFNTEDNTGDPTLESRLFSIVTGIDTDEAGLDLYGERIFNLQRAILLREGWKPGEDDTPSEYNFTKPIESDYLNPKLVVPGTTEEPISVKGNVLNRVGFEKMRKEYYELRDWDIETGLQKFRLFERLDILEVGKTLMENGLSAL